MTRRSFQRGTEVEKKSSVLTWRLPKRQITSNPPVPECPKKPGLAFGRRTTPPAG